MIDKINHTELNSISAGENGQFFPKYSNLFTFFVTCPEQASGMHENSGQTHITGENLETRCGRSQQHFANSFLTRWAPLHKRWHSSSNHYVLTLKIRLLQCNPGSNADSHCQLFISFFSHSTLTSMQRRTNKQC